MKIYLFQGDKPLRFLVVSVIVTTVDYLLFFSLYRLTGILAAHVLSYSGAILLSFSLQKRYVFQKTRQTHIAFAGVLGFSIVGVAFGYLLLAGYLWLFGSVLLAKVLMTISMFFYNFFSKKFAFGDHTPD